MVVAVISQEVAVEACLLHEDQGALPDTLRCDHDLAPAHLTNSSVKPTSTNYHILHLHVSFIKQFHTALLWLIMHVESYIFILSIIRFMQEF